MTIGTFTIVLLLYVGHRWGYLAVGSVAIGLLVGLAFSGSPTGRDIGTGVRTSAAAVGSGVKTAAQATAAAIVKDRG
jgi:hypothetical protein